MTQLMLENDLRSSNVDSQERTLAQARTLTVLRRLDSGRTRSVLDFLYEANLIKKSYSIPPVIVLGSPDSDYGAADTGEEVEDVEAVASKRCS